MYSDRKLWAASLRVLLKQNHVEERAIGYRKKTSIKKKKDQEQEQKQNKTTQNKIKHNKTEQNKTKRL